MLSLQTSFVYKFLVALAMTVGFSGIGATLVAQDRTVDRGSNIAAQNGVTGSEGIATLQTVAERSKYLATSREGDVRQFLEALDAASPHAKLISYGETHEKRPLWSLILSREENVSLPLAETDERLLIVLLGNIHSGECDGKEALLALARDMLSEESPPFLDEAVIVIAPNFNSDGNERVGKLHRPGQEGPALGMGTRENAVGHDLNRDFVKLDSPEVRSLVRMLDAWDVDVLVDAHTTNGSLHRYDLTYDVPHNPASNPEIIDWMRGTMIPTVSEAMTNRGAPIFYYGNFNREHTVWESYGFEPRYSTEYMGLRGKIGILVESYSYASYERRIEVSYAFIEECLKTLTVNARTLRPMLHRQVDEAPKQVAIRGKIAADEQPVAVSGYAFSTKEAAAQFPSPKDRDRVAELKPKDYEVTLVNRGQATLQVDAPKYYFIPKEYSWAASRIRLHGIPMIAVEGATKASVERYRIRSRKEANEFQFRRISRYEVELEKADVKLGSGWLVPTANELGVLATYLLEPHSDDSLASWGFLDPSLSEGSVYPILRLDRKTDHARAEPLAALEWLATSATDIRGEQLTLEKLFDPKSKVSYSGAPTPMPKWLPGEPSYLMQRENRWYQIDAATGAMQPFALPGKMVEALGKLTSMADGAAAPYGRQLGLFDDAFKTAMIRHKKDLILYDVASDVATQLTETPDLEEELAELSPSGQHVAFVRDQNLYVVDCKTRALKALTSDGGGEILNGKLDWVYQEEVYGRGKFQAYWWNPTGTKIAFLRLDESPVPNFVVDNSLAFAQKLENMRYPKAGQGNPRVSLRVVDVNTAEILDVPIDRFAEDDRLVVRVGWKPEAADQLVYQVQNRIQNQLDVVLFDLTSRSSRTLAHEESKAWIDVIDVPRWLADGSFLWLHDDAQGRRHISHIGVSGERRQITSGEWDVKEISEIANGGKEVWFTGHRSAPTNTDVMRLDIEGGELQTVSSQLGSHRVSVHPTGHYYFDTWSNMNHPPELWLRSRDGDGLRYHSSYRSDRMDYVESGSVELLDIPARDGHMMPAMLYKPSGSCKDGQRMPVVIHVYGGPAAPTVENTWTHRSDLWHRYLAEQGIAVLFCDNRSALGRGNSDTWKIYRNLGELELQDLEDAARWLGQQPWADADRIGLWGWSYGGYFTAYALTHSSLFKAGIAGAPVTDWRNYDSIYTERYMDTPQSNPDGYKNSSVVEAAGELQGNLLIIHGEIDDNVHMANSMQLVHALQKAGKAFELMVYPNNRHGISDAQQSAHQYRLMTDFFKRHLQP